jgi:hypothetical protein
MDVTLRDSFRPRAGVLFRYLDGETVLLNSETGLYFGLDVVGTRIWQLIVEHHQLSHVFDTMLAEYDVPASQLEDDLLALARQLQARGLMDVASPGNGA